MIDHLKIVVSDFARSARFYEAVLEPLGYEVVRRIAAEEGDPQTIAFGRDRRPVLWLTDDGEAQSGLHIALAADTRRMVDEFHVTATDFGARSNGAPGLRPIYHPNYYGAFVIDPDGNNLEAVCHVPA